VVQDSTGEIYWHSKSHSMEENKVNVYTLSLQGEKEFPGSGITRGEIYWHSKSHGR